MNKNKKQQLIWAIELIVIAIVIVNVYPNPSKDWGLFILIFGMVTIALE